MEPRPRESVLPESALGPRSLATKGGLPESTTSWDPREHGAGWRSSGPQDPPSGNCFFTRKVSVNYALPK